MTFDEAHHPFRDFAAPRVDGGLLVDPPTSELPNRLAANRIVASEWEIDFLGTSIRQLRIAARQELIQAAFRYTSNYRNTNCAVDAFHAESTSIVMAGHQPELFHPGVWFKNFVLSDLGQRTNAMPVNLIVDNDLCGATAIRVPSLVDGRLTRLAVPFDQPVAQSVPFEQRWIVDREVFRSFDRRVCETLLGVVDQPAIKRLWPYAQAAADRCASIGCSLSQARHAFEAELGLQTLELPMSVVCRSSSFSNFVLHLCLDPHRWHESYNQSLYTYRAAHGIRSHAHPVPALSREGDWYEMPMWIYGDDDPRRRAAWVRLTGSSIEISDRAERLVKVDLSRGGEIASHQLAGAASPTFKLRPRALLTTMYARLILSDLFLHGIGGAKYDQLGDRIIHRFFKVTPPDYGVLSATVLLPASDDRDPRRSTTSIDRSIRALRFAPESFADRASIPQSLVQQKQTLLNNIPERGHRASWHRQITELNQQMRSFLNDVAADLEGQRAVAQIAEKEAQVLSSREHPFPVFPVEKMLNTFRRCLSYVP